MIRPDIVQSAHVRVIQGGDRASFAVETVAEAFGRELDSHFAVEASIGSAEDLAHAPRAQKTFDLIRA